MTTMTVLLAHGVLSEIMSVLAMGCVFLLFMMWTMEQERRTAAPKPSGEAAAESKPESDSKEWKG